MNSVNDWVPTAAFIEHFVLEEALAQDLTIGQASSIVLPRFDMTPDGPFLHRQTRLLGMLYTLLVFPREQLTRDGLVEVVVERALADSELKERNKNLLTMDFLRSVRNAVSHARIGFSDETITFRDGRNEASPRFEVTLTISDAVNLLLVLGRAFHKSAQTKKTLANVGRSQ